MQHFLWPFAIVITIALMGVAAPRIHVHTHGEPRYQPHEVEAAKESIALSLLGQLQLSVGDLMWLKSMEYLHVGMVQRMPTRAEEEFGFRRQDSQNTAAGLGHTEGLNMVLDRERDWRGVFGEIERNVAPYSTEHKHDDPVELIPWYQLAVRLNPSLERLYTLGAFYLADFAHEPGEAREMLEAGIEANPFSFEIHGALGRLYVDFAERLDELEHHHEDHHDDEDRHDDVDDDHEKEDAHHPDEDDEHGEEEDHHDDAHEEHHIETPEQAYAEAAELLARAVELAEDQRRQMAANRQVFDDFQNQVFGESFLYLSKARLALKDYDGAITAAETGHDAASGYNQRNLLRVQARVAHKAHMGEAADDEELATLARARGYSDTQSFFPEASGPSNSDWKEDPALPVSILAGIAPPDELPTVANPETLKPLLDDVRGYPYETISQRAARLGSKVAEAQAQMKQLIALRFVDTYAVNDDETHALSPPGLYVSRGEYGFDFWQAMEQEALALKEQGVDIEQLAANLTRHRSE